MKKKIIISICLIAALVSVLCSCTLPESLTNYNYSTPRPTATTPPNIEIEELEMVSVIRGNYISEEIVEGFSCTVYENGVQIDGITEENTSTAVVIPEKLLGYTVIGIGKEAFYNNTALQTVELPLSLKYIDTAAFCYCTNLEINTLPDGLVYVGSRAFNFCESIVEMDFPDGVTYIGEHVLSSTNVANIDIPLSMDYVPVGLYYNTKISDVKIPEHVTRIDASAFANCSLVEKLVITSNVIEMNDRAFAYNHNLTTIVIEEGLTALSYGVFAGCLKLESITIPESVVSVGNGSFLECDDEFVIIGKEGSRAEEFALEQKYEFIVME
ncbi:MAG: leucine-rich repeat domain-containing protein [Clostridia bacterium]|nr:leucine-rich repeat domain-containing protein [Clostridia bacterium]